MKLRCPKCQEIVQVDVVTDAPIPCTRCGAKMRLPATTPPPAAAAPAITAVAANAAVAPPVAPPVAAPQVVAAPVVAPPAPPIPASPAAARDLGDKVASPAQIADEKASPPTQPAFRFAVKAYNPDSEGGGLAAVLLILGLEIATALILGLIASFVARLFYLIFMFPFLIGVGTGMAGALGVRIAKRRSIVVAVVAGLLSGCVAMFAMHYSDYLNFAAEAAAVREGKHTGTGIFRAPQKSGDDLRQAAGGATPADALKVQNFLDYIDFTAKEGVSIGSARVGQSASFNLGYVGTYVYYLLEILMVAAVALLCVIAATAVAPHCRTCKAWKRPYKLGYLKNPPDEAAEAVRLGDLGRLTPGKKTTARLLMHLCPNCRGDAPLELKVEEVSKNAKSEKKFEELAHMTYPGEALTALKVLFPKADLGNAAKSDSTTK